MGLHFLEVMEDISLQVLSERYIGKIKFESGQDFEKECLRRIALNYNEEEIANLKSNIPNNFIAKVAKYQEILSNLLKYMENEFIPSTNKMRDTFRDQLTIKEKEDLQKVRYKYLVELESEISYKKTKIKKDEKLSEIEKPEKLREIDLIYKLYQLIPKLEGNKDMEKDWYLDISIIAKKFNEIPKEYKEEYLNLMQKRYKIRLGRLGNIVSTIMSFNENEELETKNGMIELLFIE